MKKLILVLCALVVSSPALARHHHRNPFVSGLGIGLAHMMETVEPHPSGCPWTAFCGCGVSTRVFGHPVRNLYLAAAWYKFPRASRAPGNVIVRRHHVQYIDHEDRGSWICYDPNSGGHLTRMHACQFAGGTVVNPRM